MSHYPPPIAAAFGLPMGQQAEAGQVLLQRSLGPRPTTGNPLPQIGDNPAGSFVIVGANLRDADYTSIKAAIDAGHNLIYVLSGTYTETEKITVDHHVHLVGASRASCIVNYGATADALFDVTADVAFESDGIQFIGGGVAGQRVVKFGAAVQGTYINVFENVTALNFEKIFVADAASFAFMKLVNVNLQCANLSTARHWDGPGYIDGLHAYFLSANGTDPRGGFANADNNLTVFLVGGQLEVLEGDVASIEMFNVACYFSDESSPLTPTAARSRFVSCRFRDRAGGNAARYIDLPAGANNATIGSCYFNGALSESVRTASLASVVADNINCKVTETGDADYNQYDNNTGFDGSTILGDNSTVNGAKRYGAAAATTDAYATLLTHTNPKGVSGSGAVKNTDGAADSLTVEEQGIDAFGTTDVRETAVAAGNYLILDPASAIGTARPPYVSYRVRVKNTTPGANAAHSTQFVSQGSVS